MWPDSDVPYQEQPVISDLIDLCLSNPDYEIRISDFFEPEEDDETLTTKSKALIMKNLNATDGDLLEVFDPTWMNLDFEPKRLGWFALIYNNGTAYGDVMQVIHDYSANPWADKVWKTLDEKHGG